MPKNEGQGTMLKVLKRLRALDAQLANMGVRLSAFARQQGVTQRTVRRDLETLEAMGFKAHADKHSEENVVWRYQPYVRGLFSDSWVPRVSPPPNPKIAAKRAAAKPT